MEFHEKLQELRKSRGLTQEELAEALFVSRTAISKWESGKGLPDPVYMLELCRLLDISVNELLTGEFIEETKYQQKAEDNLLIMSKQEVKQTKKMFFYENVIGIGSTIIFAILIFMSVYFVENGGIKILLFIFAFLFLITGVSIALKIETEEGYYECQKCHHKYIPSYRQVYFAMHIGRTRYMKCPHCQKRSWQKKIYSK